MIYERDCRRCRKATEHELGRSISASGGESYGLYCLECHGWSVAKTGGIWIASATIVEQGIDLSTLRTIETHSGPRCVRCGVRGAELHHWAPRGIFGVQEADKWPTDYLCQPCHRRWHDEVTPSLMRRSA